MHIQFTKISKENHYYIGTNLEEIKKKSTTGVAKFVGCENLQPYEISQGLQAKCEIARAACLFSAPLLLPIFDLHL